MPLYAQLPQQLGTEDSPLFESLTVSNMAQHQHVSVGASFQHEGSTLGLFQASPVTQPGPYNITNVTPLRSYDASAITASQLANVLGTLIADQQAVGVIG